MKIVVGNEKHILMFISPILIIKEKMYGKYSSFLDIVIISVDILNILLKVTSTSLISGEATSYHLNSYICRHFSSWQTSLINHSSVITSMGECSLRRVVRRSPDSSHQTDRSI